ncbi:MAG: ABC transporter permease [Microthrixaceae bacterium]
MRLALTELRRRPGRFVAATAILTLIAILLMFIGGLLDGLLDSSTGAYRAQRGELIAYSESASESLPRSQIPVNLRKAVESVSGVTKVGGLGTTQVAARPGDDPESRDLISTILIGSEIPPLGLDEIPEKGTAFADSSVKADGIKVGDTLLLGAPRVPIKIVGFVDDSRYAGQVSLWASLDTWNEAAQQIRPGTGDPEFVQAMVIGSDRPDLASQIADIEKAADGHLEVLTIPDAIEALPGVSTQRSTINQIIGVTVLIALVVVALFFALITIERTALYGVLKAIGASSMTLFAGVTAQAVAVTLIASTIAAALAIALAVAIPPGSLPFSLTAARVLFSVGLLLFAAVIGCAFSLRRVLRIDPATAIGA